MLTLNGIIVTNQNSEALGKFTLIQDITFANSTGTVSVFTVTGDVLIRIIPVITTFIKAPGKIKSSAAPRSFIGERFAVPAVKITDAAV